MSLRNRVRWAEPPTDRADVLLGQVLGEERLARRQVLAAYGVVDGHRYQVGMLKFLDHKQHAVSRSSEGEVAAPGQRHIYHKTTT